MAARAISSLPIPTSPLLPARLPNAATRSSLSVIPRRASSFLGCRLPLSPSSTPRVHRPCRPHPAAASILSMLPTANPERASSGTNTKWSSRAIKSFGMAELEARKLKYPTTGTEALLMGILVEGTSQAAQFLRANGITLFKVREETVKLLGKSDMYFFSPEHPPLTEPAQKALDWAVDEKLKSGEDGEITVAYMLLGIWAQEDSAGHKILASLGFDDDKAKELAKSLRNPACNGFESGNSLSACGVRPLNPTLPSTHIGKQGYSDALQVVEDLSLWLVIPVCRIFLAPI